MRIPKRQMRRCLAGSGAGFLLCCAPAAPAAAELAHAALQDKGGKAVGDVDLVPLSSGVLLRISLKGVPAGEHAIHVHAVGRCEPPFDSAGPHFNPAGNRHGMLAGDGHAGDLPNLHVPQGGVLTVELVSTALTLEPSKPHSLLDADGSALVVHAGADDYRSDPDGKAGERIACGVIVPSGTTAGRSPRN